MKLPKHYENPDILHEGTMPDRAYYIPYPNEDSALNLHRTDSTRFIGLDGSWMFAYYPNPYSVPESFIYKSFCPEKAGFTSLPVPSVWQMHGFDRHQYINHNYPIPYDPPFVPFDNPCGAYVRDFFIGDDACRFKNILYSRELIPVFFFG